MDGQDWGLWEFGCWAGWRGVFGVQISDFRTMEKKEQGYTLLWSARGDRDGHTDRWDMGA